MSRNDRHERMVREVRKVLDDYALGAYRSTEALRKIAQITRRWRKP